MSDPTKFKFKFKCVVFPASMGAATHAVDLFGANRVDVGRWLEPVYVKDVTIDEYEAAKELLGDVGLKISIL